LQVAGKRPGVHRQRAVSVVKTGPVNQKCSLASDGQTR
jgi:hypothetical protein